LLAGLRVLDLTDERGAMCGSMFAELGAEVIKVEPVEGCRSRRVDPYLDGIPGPDRSLYFLAYQAGKRSVTLNLDSGAGRQVLGDLVGQADFLVESYGPGYFEARGMSYAAWAEANPRLIYCSITPFGDRGPGAEWAAADLVSWAAGGMAFLAGLPGRPPLQISLPQAGLHAGAEAATASLLAHFTRLASGRGQKVVVNTQACVVWTLMNEQAFPVLHGDYMTRAGGLSGAARQARRGLWPCADGHVVFGFAGYPFAESSRHMVEWMAEQGAAPDWLQAVDFNTWSLARFVEDPDPEFLNLVQKAEEALGAFLAARTKAQLYEGALARRLLLAPVSTAQDIAEDEQLAARGYFRTVAHPHLGRDLVLPGAFVKFSASPAATLTPAPRLGEHNIDIYAGRLGYSRTRLQHLYSTGVI
jgi:crotonobetainyl-CoA:carnitine CoA-transferase CaiB-like acyl-CoA transferase